MSETRTYADEWRSGTPDRACVKCKGTGKVAIVSPEMEIKGWNECRCVEGKRQTELHGGRDPGKATLCGKNKKTVYVRLIDGNVIKRHIKKDRGWLQDHCPEALR